MAAKPSIAIVGPGRLGAALAVELRRAGYAISEIVSRNNIASKRSAADLARKVGVRPSNTSNTRLNADVIWFCVPDREIKNAAHQLASVIDWKGKIAFHSSGALLSDELDILRRRGAAVASLHPLMTFVSGSIPSLKGRSICNGGRCCGDPRREAHCAQFGRRSIHHSQPAQDCLPCMGIVCFAIAGRNACNRGTSSTRCRTIRPQKRGGRCFRS